MMNTSAPIFVRNIAAGPFQPTGFLMALGIAQTEVKSVATEMDARSKGFGSFVWRMDGEFPARSFAAAFHEDGEWRCVVNKKVFNLTQSTVDWRKIGLSIGGIGLAQLSIGQGGKDGQITYLRPWLRHWFEDMWSQDDIDIGSVISLLSHSEDARARLALRLNG